MDARKNFAFGTLASGINSAATSLTVGSGEGARFPAVSFNAVIWNKTDYASPAHAYQAGAAEIVRVTNISTDTLAITRAQEGTSAVNLNTGGKTYEIWAGPTDNYWTQQYSNGALMTTRGDLVRRGASIPERVALGSTGAVLFSDGTDAIWSVREKLGYLTSDVATTSGTAVDVTGLGFAIGANEVWAVEFWLGTTASAGAGIKFAVAVPSGATLGGHARGTVSTAAIISASGTLTVAQMTASAAGVYVAVLIQNSTNAGNVQLQFASGDGVVTATIKANQSYYKARRIS